MSFDILFMNSNEFSSIIYLCNKNMLKISINIFVNRNLITFKIHLTILLEEIVLKFAY